MARLQRKQHLDSLEIHSVRDDVLANKPQLFSLHLLVMQLPGRPPFVPHSALQLRRLTEIREFCCIPLFPLWNVSRFTLNRLRAQAVAVTRDAADRCSEGRAYVSRLFTACPAALVSVVSSSSHAVAVASQATGCSSRVSCPTRAAGWKTRLDGDDGGTLGLDIPDPEHG